MEVYFSYLIKSAYGENIEDEIAWTSTFENEQIAVDTLKKTGYVQVDDRNYKKKVNSTLYHVATLPKKDQKVYAG